MYIYKKHDNVYIYAWLKSPGKNVCAKIKVLYNDMLTEFTEQLMYAITYTISYMRNCNRLANPKVMKMRYLSSRVIMEYYMSRDCAEW